MARHYEIDADTWKQMIASLRLKGSVKRSSVETLDDDPLAPGHEPCGCMGMFTRTYKKENGKKFVTTTCQQCGATSRGIKK